MIKIPVYQPSLIGNEKKYVNDCLDSTWISSKGSYIKKFEDEFSKKININFSTTVSNGTVALHVALLALGVCAGDEVIVPTFTYIASVNAITYVGAQPVFIDSVFDTWQMDPEDIERKITSRTKAILVVHLYGHPCNMEAILKISKKHKLKIIEDCAEAFGSKYLDKYVGGFGDISTFSFFGNKTITTGEGGMVSTNDEKLYERAVHFKGQGLAKNLEYWHDVIGYNYRMTNICAAIGLAQLEQADHFISRKREIAECYRNGLSKLPIIVHQESENIFHTYWMISILVENLDVKNALRKFLLDKGIETRPLFNLANTMPMYINSNSYFPVAKELSSRGINLPSWPMLSQDSQDYIISNINKFYQ